VKAWSQTEAHPAQRARGPAISEYSAYSASTECQEFGSAIPVEGFAGLPRQQAVQVNGDSPSGRFDGREAPRALPSAACLALISGSCSALLEPDPNLKIYRSNFDTLVGCCLHAASSSDGTEGLMIETFAEGWWYTAAVPRGGRVIACMTDADRVRPLGLSCGEGLERLLAETKHVQQVVDISRPIDRPKIYPAGSRQLQGKTTLPLLCVGDAAMCYDLVSGQGIIKALRSGIFAAYAIGDFLGNGDVRGLSRYRLMLEVPKLSFQKSAIYPVGEGFKPP
jgi:hypothetical protein